MILCRPLTTALGGRSYDGSTNLPRSFPPPQLSTTFSRPDALFYSRNEMALQESRKLVSMPLLESARRSSTSTVIIRETAASAQDPLYAIADAVVSPPPYLYVLNNPRSDLGKFYIIEHTSRRFTRMGTLEMC